MPLIPFPDVPMLPGVPNLPRLPGINVDLPAVDPSLVFDNPAISIVNEGVATGWAILDDDGNPALLPDSFVAFEFRGETRICNYPVEQGSFSAYNKVLIPYDIRLVMSCSGQFAMSRDDFIRQLDIMLNSTEIFTIATPDGAYPDMNLVHFDYRKTSRDGVSLLQAMCFFEEVMQTAVAEYENTRQPSGNDPASQGQVIATPPNKEQQASFESSPIQ